MGASASTARIHHSNMIEMGKDGVFQKDNIMSKNEITTIGYIQLHKPVVPKLIQSNSERSIGFHMYDNRRSNLLASNANIKEFKNPTIIDRNRKRKSNRRGSLNQVTTDTEGILPLSDEAIAAITLALRKFMFETTEMYEKIPIILKEMKCCTLDPKEFLCEQGKTIKTIYIIQSGIVSLSSDGSFVEEKSTGTIIGQNAFLGNESYEYTAQTRTKCILWSMQQESFEKVRDQASESSIVHRVARLRKIPALSKLCSNKLHLIASKLIVHSCEIGYCIYSMQAHQDHFLLFIDQGEVQINKLKYFSGDIINSYDLEINCKVVAQNSTQYAFITDYDMSTILGISLKDLSSVYASNSCRDTGQDSSKMILEDLEILEKIGSGSFGEVFMVRDRRNGDILAMKKMLKQTIVEAEQVQQVFNEKEILSKISDPFILKLYATFQDIHYLYIITEMVHGGELYSRIYNNDKDGLLPPTAQFYAANVVLALRALHSNNVIYRDLKPENLILDRFGYLRLIDMGFAKTLQSFDDPIGMDQRSTTVCGTPEYLAPEFILNNGYGMAVDYWSLGILLYEMLIGYTPFGKDTDDHNCIFSRIIASESKGIDFPSVFSRKYPLAKSLIRQLLQWNPRKRIGCGKKGMDEVLHHQYFRNISWKQMKKHETVAPYLPQIKSTIDASNFSVEEEESDIQHFDSNIGSFDNYFKEF